MDKTLIFGSVIDVSYDAVLIEVDGKEIWVPRSSIENGISINNFSDLEEFWIGTRFCENTGLIN